MSDIPSRVAISQCPGRSLFSNQRVTTLSILRPRIEPRRHFAPHSRSRSELVERCRTIRRPLSNRTVPLGIETWQFRHILTRASKMLPRTLVGPAFMNLLPSGCVRPDTKQARHQFRDWEDIPHFTQPQPLGAHSSSGYTGCTGSICPNHGGAERFTRQVRKALKPGSASMRPDDGAAWRGARCERSCLGFGSLSHC